MCKKIKKKRGFKVIARRFERVVVKIQKIVRRNKRISKRYSVKAVAKRRVCRRQRKVLRIKRRKIVRCMRRVTILIKTAKRCVKRGHKKICF